MSTCRGIEELDKPGNGSISVSTAPHVACAVPSGWARNLLLVTHSSLTDQRLQPYSKMYSASELKSVLDDNWPRGEVQTQIDVLDIECQVDHERHSIKWEQRVGDMKLLSYLSDVRLDASSPAVSWATLSN